MARRRYQKSGLLRVESGSWLLTYRVYALDGTTKRQTVKIGPAVRMHRKKGGKWKAEGPILDRDGLSARQAERLAWDQYLSKVDSIAVRPGQSATVADFWESRYWPWAEGVLRLNVTRLRQYKTIYRAWIEPVVGSVALVDVGLEHAEAVIAGAVRADRSPATARQIRKVGSLLFSRAQDLDCYDRRNPFSRVRVPPPEPVRERYALTPGQAREILDRVSVRYRPMVEPALLTGLNVAELMGLTWGDLDFDGGEIHVRRQFSEEGKGYGPLKARSRKRDVPISGRLYGVLGLPGEPGAPVFQGIRGTPANGRNIQKRYLKDIGEKMGLPGSLGWHIFRHTFATWLADLAVRDYDIRALMGHTQSGVTNQVYVHANTDRLSGAVESVARHLGTSGAVVTIRKSA